MFLLPCVQPIETLAGIVNNVWNQHQNPAAFAQTVQCVNVSFRHTQKRFYKFANNVFYISACMRPITYYIINHEGKELPIRSKIFSSNKIQIHYLVINCRSN